LNGSYNTASSPNATASGKSNTASGNYSTASGAYTTASGQYSDTRGNGTTASGNYSTASGVATTASALYSTASGYCTLASGSYSTASGSYTFAICDFSTALGFYSCASLFGQRAYANGSFSRSVPDAQSIKMVLRQNTPNATPLNMYLDGSSAVITIKTNSMLLVNVFTSGIETSASNKTASSQDYVVIRNVAGTTSIVHQHNINQHFDTGGMAITISANDTNDSLQIEVEGTANDMRWVSYVTGTEVLFAT
jgi:hypothetical protein